MNGLQKFLAALGRMCVSLIFLLVGISSIFYWETMQREFLGVIANLEIYTKSSESTASLLERLSTLSNVVLVVWIVLQILGGLSLFFGYRVKLGSFLLLLYMIPSTLIYHHFWYLEGDQFAESFILFLQNLAIIGALFIIFAVGKGETPKPVVEKKKPVKDETAD